MAGLRETLEDFIDEARARAIDDAVADMRTAADELRELRRIENPTEDGLEKVGDLATSAFNEVMAQLGRIPDQLDPKEAASTISAAQMYEIYRDNGNSVPRAHDLSSRSIQKTEGNGLLSDHFYRLKNYRVEGTNLVTEEVINEPLQVKVPFVFPGKGTPDLSSMPGQKRPAASAPGCWQTLSRN